MAILNQIDINKLFNTSYIFEITPVPNSSYLYLTIIFGLMILFGIVAYLRYQKIKKQIPIWSKMQGKVFSLLFYTGLSGLALIFFRWQQIAYLGSRLFMLLLFLVFIIWGIFVIYYRMRILPKELLKFEQKKRFEKYLP